MAKIETKTTRLFILISAIAAILIAGLALWQFRRISEKEAIEKMQYQTKYLSQSFEQELQQLQFNLKTIEAGISLYYPQEGLTEKNIAKFKMNLEAYLLNLVHKMKPLSLWLVINPNLVEGEHTVSLYDKNQDGRYTRSIEYNTNNYDITQENFKWWSDAIKYGETWTEPYYWENWDMELISHTKTDSIDDTFIGVIGSDFDFSVKRKNWGTLKVFKTGYIVLLNKDLSPIVHPSLEKQCLKNHLQPQDLNRLKTALQQNTSGHLHYKFNGNKKIMTFELLSNGWVLLAVTPEKEVYASIIKISRFLLILLAGVLLLSVLFSRLFSKTIVAPINTLEKLFKAAENGNLAVRSAIKTNDQLEQLGQRFNFFMHQMQSMITQLKNKEKALVKAKEKAEESERLKMAFLANMSHEIRTPMNAIMGFSSLLNQEEFSEEEKMDFTSLIQSNSQYLLLLIDDIIDMSKIEANQLTIHTESFDFIAFFDEIIANWKVLAQQNNPHLAFCYSNATGHEKLLVHSDPNRLNQIINNLLDNAFKFTEKGQVKLSCKLSSNKLIVTVEDSGIGIAIEDIPKIFARFRKSETSANKLYRGAGLGLAISAKLAELLQGSLSVKSKINSGSTFSIELPYSPQD